MVPFQGSPLEVAAAHWNRPLPSLPRAVPPEVAALVADLTAKDTADRPAIAAEVAGRAGRLRDAITGHRTARLQQLTQSPAPAYTAALPLTPPETRLPDQVPGRGHQRRGRAWSWRQLALAVAAALFLAALGSALAGSLSHTLQWRPSPGQSPEPSLLSGPPASYPKSASSPSPRHPHGQERGSQQGNDDGSG